MMKVRDERKVSNATALDHPGDGFSNALRIAFDAEEVKRYIQTIRSIRN